MSMFPLLLLLGLSARAAAFAPPQPRRLMGTSSSTATHYVPREKPENYSECAPPFSDAESPQARARRMEMARELQKVFYKEPEAESTTSSLLHAPMPNGSSNYPYGSSAIRNLPTLTSNDGIKSADGTALLPGYQFVWTIDHPAHCHMFHSILSGPAPWYFAHVYIPSSAAGSEDDGDQQVDHMQSYHDVKQQLKSNSPLYGTLLRITDRRFQDEDGRIVLAVQAIDRVRVNSVSSGSYLSTDVQLSPEDELMKSFFDKALLSSASYLSSHATDEENEALSCPSAVRGAARAAAAADTLRIRRFEFLPIFLEEKPTRPSSATSLRSSPNDSNATRKIKDAIRKQEEKKEDSGPEYVPVVQLVNYDAFAYSSMGNTHSVLSQALKSYWENLAKQTQGSSSEDDFSGVSADSSSSFYLPEPAQSSPARHVSPEAVEMVEWHVWRTLDEMMRLLSMAATATVPLPSQLLGLLPKRDDWPREFMLEDYAKSLATSGSTIGTTFKSPFVRVDQISSTDPSSYSSMRRAQRLSYAIWLLLDGLAMADAQPQPPPRHVLLQMESVEERLRAAKDILEGINVVLKKMIPNRKDTDEKK